MIAALLLATLSAAQARPPARAPPPAHAAEEAALLRAAYPDHDQKSGFLGHGEGYLVEQSSACAEGGTCYLVVAARDGESARRGRARLEHLHRPQAGRRRLGRDGSRRRPGQQRLGALAGRRLGPGRQGRSVLHRRHLEQLGGW